MNEYLAELYGTADAAGGEDHLEKAASVVLLEKIAEEQGVDLSDIDLDDLSEEDLDALITEAIGDEGEEGIEAEYAEGGEEEAEKEAMAKMAEADFLGRTMAHAYANEMQEMHEAELEKEAGGKEKLLELLAAAKAKAAKGAKRAFPMRYSTARAEAREAIRGKVRGTRLSAKERAKRGGKALARMAPEAALAGGAAYKAASALDTLAIQRAEEWLGKVAESEEEHSTGDQLEEAVDQRALEMLIEAGYIDPSELE